MNYIYDIVVNFNMYAFDFYDWNTEDKITHIRKIPVCKVTPDVLKKLIDYEVRFDASFLEILKDKTEVFTNKNVKTIPYSCLLCDGMNALAIKIDKNRTFKSRLQLDEEEEVVDVCEKLNVQDICFEVKKKYDENTFTTRRQMNLARQVNKMLHRTYTLKDYETLKYIYYECFNKKTDDIKEIMKKLSEQIQKKDDKLLLKIRDFYKLFEIKK